MVYFSIYLKLDSTKRSRFVRELPDNFSIALRFLRRIIQMAWNGSSVERMSC